MTPIAHSGLALLGWGAAARKKRHTLLLFLIIASLPDIDFLLALFPGKNPFSLHQYYTHNLLFTLITTLCAFPFTHGLREKTGLSLAALSHLLLDLFTRDPAPPFGFRLFFPFSDQLFNISLMPNMNKDALNEIFSWHNAAVAAFELFFFLIPAIWLFRRDLKSYIISPELNQP